jgi:hypothetical protein
MKRKSNALGSGFIIDRSGLILTNNPVVEKADEIKIRLEIQQEYDATIFKLVRTAYSFQRLSFSDNASTANFSIVILLSAQKTLMVSISSSGRRTVRISV